MFRVGIRYSQIFIAWVWKPEWKIKQGFFLIRDLIQSWDKIRNDLRNKYKKQRGDTPKKLSKNDH